MKPLVFNDTIGWLKEAPGSCGVVIAGGHGFEDLCSRRFLSLLADRIAQSGLPVLQFDYPGCGDAAGDHVEPGRVAAWVDSIGAAADELKRQTGVRQVIVVDRIDERLAMAQRSGADWVLNNGNLDLHKALEEKGIKPTLIIDAACHPSILQEAITLASPAARIVLMGFSSDPSQIVQQGITGKELSIFSSRLNANKFPVVIDWLEKGLIDPEKLITHTFDYHHVTDAIELFEKDQRQCCKVLLTFDQ